MDGGDYGWAQPLIQLATGGGFAALVWYLVVKHIPGIETRHQSERAEWLGYIKKRDDEFEEIYRQQLQEQIHIRTELRHINEALNRSN